jgi:hypothetical protein
MPTYNLPPGVTPEQGLIYLREQERRRAGTDVLAKMAEIRADEARFNALCRLVDSRNEAVEDAKSSGMSDAEVQAIVDSYERLIEHNQRRK